MMRPINDQARLLSALEVGECRSAEALMSLTGLPQRDVIHAAGALIVAGWATRAEEGCLMLTKAGEKARKSGRCLKPILRRKDGQKKGSQPVHNHKNRQLIWSALRMQRKTTVSRLAEITGVEMNLIRQYMRELSKTGYIRVLSGRDDERYIRYALIRDTGPDSPQWNEDAEVMTDRNTREVFGVQP